MKYLDIDYIKGNLRTRQFGRELFYFEESGSTSDQLLSLLSKDGLSQGALVLAEQQTAGKGRQGNSWYSPPATGLYFSLLLRPNLPSVKLSGLTLAFGALLAESIEKIVGVPLYVKWPNDLYCHNKKIGGILTEMQSQSGLINTVVVGIGLNVNNEVIPSELQEKASSLYLETRQTIFREDLLIGILADLERDYETFIARGFEVFAERLNSRFYLKNRRVSVEDGLGIPLTGVVTGFDLDGGLMLINDRGQAIKCTAGTVLEIGQ